MHANFWITNWSNNQATVDLFFLKNFTEGQ